MRVEQLAAECGLSVDTIRYYQKIGLLHAPQRCGRVAEYGDSHLTRLAEIRHLSEAGFTLAQIGRLNDSYPEPLLRVLSEEGSDADTPAAVGPAAVDPAAVGPAAVDPAAVGPAAVDPAASQTLSLGQVAEISRLDRVVCELAIEAGLIWPVAGDAVSAVAGAEQEPQFSPSAVEMLRVGQQLLEAGIPLEDLLAIAALHASNIGQVAESAVDLFAKHLHPANRSSKAGDNLGSLVEQLVPLVTNLVAQHFQRTLVAKATQRLTDNHQSDPSDAVPATTPTTCTTTPTTCTTTELADCADPPSSPIVMRRFSLATLLGTASEPAESLDPPPVLDPLRVFAAATTYAQRCYWAVPDDDIEIAAIGAAVTLDAPQCETRFADVDTALQNLDIQVVGEPGPPITGALLLGGFAFQTRQTRAGAQTPSDNHSQPATSARSPNWAAFGAGGLTLPEVLVVRSGTDVFVTVAHEQAIEQARQLVKRSLDHSLDADHRSTDLAPGSVNPINPPDIANPTDGPDTSPSNSANPTDGPDNSAAQAARNFNYMGLVAQALVDIDAGLLDKVVTARIIEQPCPQPPAALLSHLRDHYRTCAVFAFTRGDHTFLGATPELLVEFDGTTVRSEAVAGSRPRSTDPAQDAALADDLLANYKELREHAVVVREIRSALSGVGVELTEPAEPRVMQLTTIQHLHTPIKGAVRTSAVEQDTVRQDEVEQDTPRQDELAETAGKASIDRARILNLVAALHPTPAVAGNPRATALNWINRHERFDRGWYAAPVGWATPDGRGEFRVALRCALLSPTATMTLFAGGGIVAGADPEAELAETSTKFEVLLSAARPSQV